MTRRFAALAVALTLALGASSDSSNAIGSGAVSLTALDVASTEDFNTLASATGTAFTTLPAGWFLSESGTSARNNDAYAVSTGADVSGDVYSFGSAASADRAFGGLRSGTLAPIVGAAFINSTGAALSSLDISYTGEQWRAGVANRGAFDRIDFQYSLDATSLITGTWTDVNALDFQTTAAGAATSPAAATNGNDASYRTATSASITGLAIPPNATFWIRWTDFDISSSDDGLAVDDFSMTPHGGGGASVSINNVEIQEGDSGTIDANFTVTVNGAHAGVSFDIATADGSGANAATAASGDYDARSESAITIPAGQATYSFVVTINGDTTLELDETFFVNLSNVTGAALADGQGLGTIVNDDEPPPVVTDVVISQVYGGGSNSGAPLTHDFVELFNRGTTSVDLTGWSVQYSSAAGSGPWSVTPLSGSIAPGGYYLVREGGGTVGTPLPAPDATGTILMGAGAGKIALQVTSPAIVGACPLSGTADLVGYGATATCFEGAGPTGAPGNTTAALRKRGGCFDSDNNNIDFSIGNPLPRNSASPTRSCVPEAAQIHTIQGDGLASPLAGLDVITTGIVTGVKSNGFFLQEPDASIDGNLLTSEGIFVFTAAQPAVVAGHAVSARGTVTEFFNLTQIEASLPGDIAVQSSGNTLPAALELTPAILDPTGTPDQLEPLEGMRVHADSLISVAPTDEFGEIATVLTGVARPLRQRGIPASDPLPPDPSGAPDCCIPIFDENPERIFIDSEGLVGAGVISVTSNVTIDNVTGPLDFTFGAYKVLPETPPSVGALMSGIPVPAPDVDELTVGGFNIENFAGDATRRKKASFAIRQLMRSPDIIGHIEILDLPTLQGLATQVNDDSVAAGDVDPLYQAVLIPAPLGGTQNVGFLVKTSRVRIDSVTQERASDTFVNPNTGMNETLHDRPPLVLKGTFDATGLNPRPVIVVVNHLRSFIDIELVGGEGPRVRAKRKAQAESTAGLLQELQTENPDTAVISIGDYNAYQFSDGYTDPIATLKGDPTPDDEIVVDGSPDLVEPNFVNLTDALPPAEQYSFIFEGTPQALDHVLVNTVAASYVQRYAIGRGNADFPELPAALFAANPDRPERASDHDMPIAYFRFPPPSADVAVTVSAEPATAAVGANVTYTIVVTNNGISPAQSVVVTETLPALLTFVSCSATGDGVCGGPATAPTASYALLAPGTSETITIVAGVSCAAPNGASLAANVSAASTTGDPDGTNNSSSAIVIASNAPPTIGDASANPPQLLTLTFALTPITIDYTVSDSCGPVTTTLSVVSNEAVTARPNQQGKPGSTSPDWQVVDDHHVLVRAERSVKGDGRVYTITIRSVDAAGGVTTKEVTVTMPRHLPD